MISLLSNLFRVDRREKNRRLSHRRSRTLGCERLEERVTLSAASTTTVDPIFTEPSAGEGGIVLIGNPSEGIVIGIRGIVLSDLNNDYDSSYVASNRFLTSDIWHSLNIGQRLDNIGQRLDLNLGSGIITTDIIPRHGTAITGLFAGTDDGTPIFGVAPARLAPIQLIPAPEPTTEPQPSGGTVSLAEIFDPNSNSRSGNTVATYRATQSAVEQTAVTTERPTRNRPLPAAQGRDIAFEVAFSQPSLTKDRAFKATESTLNLPISQSIDRNLEEHFSPEKLQGVQVAATFGSPILGETSVRNAGDFSPRRESAERHVTSIVDDPNDEVIGKGQYFEPPSPALADTVQSPPHETNTVDQVFADWHDRRAQIAQIREQDHHFVAWEIVVALAFGGLMVRCQHLPIGSDIEQEPPQRKNLRKTSATRDDLA